MSTWSRTASWPSSTPGVEDIDRLDRIGVGNILWGNDLPHPEGTYPFTVWIRERFHDVPREDTARILGLTAAELYRLDLNVLRPLADEIGPSVEDVHGEKQRFATPA